MRNFWLILSVLWLWTCSGGGDKATGPEEPPIVINLTSLGGQAQKGPFNNGTAINVAELTNALSPTGRNFSSAITDNTGRFAVANVQLESPYVELRANGYYFNEVSNEISSGQLTLFALSNLTGKTSLNVNILTHLEKNRMVSLMSGDNPKTFAQAKLQAQEEVLAIFDYSRANVPESELLDISQDGAANAKLLAMSAIIQGDLTVGQMSQLLANISTDIASDGTLDDTNLRNTLIENSKNLDMEEVRSNLVTHYTSLGISATIPDFESEINQFLKPPVANDMSASTGEDAPINITLAGSDPEGESLTYTILEVNNATVTLNGNVANYNPDANFNGTDTFTYYANDGTSDSNIATVTMTVSAEDDDPNTQNAAATTDEDVAVVLQLTAEEYDGDSYSFGIISQPTNGSVSLDGVNATYTPDQDFNGTDTFTFEATDDTGRIMNVATATININPVNDAPVLVTTSVTESVNEEESIDITITATDVDGDQLTFQDATMDENGNEVVTDGTISINGNVYTYTLGSDIELSEGQTYGDSFYYYANDNSGEKTAYGFATITTVGVDDLPHADDKTVFTAENTALDILLTSTDPDGGDNSNLQYEITSESSNGSTSLNGATVTYTPNTDFSGNDSFQYKVSGDNTIATVSIEVNEVVGISKIFPDLVSSDYNEWFNDIVYDESTGGYLVGGISINKNDSGSGGTKEMFYLATDANLNTTSYQTVSTTLNSWGNPDQYYHNSAHRFDISERVLAGGYLFSTKSDYLWSVAAGGTVTYGQFSGSITSGYNWIDYIKASYQTSDGGYLIYGIVSKDGDFQDKYPVIAKIDASLNIEYFKILDSHVASSSAKYSTGYMGMVAAGNDSEYFLVAATQRSGFSNSNAIQFYKVNDDGSSLSVVQYADLSSPSNSPTNLISNELEDSMVFISGGSSADSEFAVITNDKTQGPGDDRRLTKYSVDSSGNVQVLGNFDLENFGGSDQTFIEVVNSGTYIYIVTTSDEETSTSDIYVTQLNQDLSLNWEKIIDLTGLGYHERLGGVTSINFGSSGTGIAITGSTVGEDGGDFNGFILLLDENGERIY